MELMLKNKIDEAGGVIGGMAAHAVAREEGQS
jgi:hypothetical protein